MEKKNYVVAVDIGSSEVTLAVGSLTDNGLVAVEAVVTKKTKGGVLAGMIDNSQVVSEALRAARHQAEQQVGISITDAYVAISGKFVRCARYTDHVFVEDAENCISQRDLAALSERMRNVKAPDSEFIMDLFPLNYKGDTGVEMRNPVGCYSKQLSSTYNFILCEHIAKDRLRRVFLDAGIKIREIFAGAAIIGDSILSADEKEDGVAVIDIGGGLTDVAIYHKGVLAYMASIPLGGQSVTSDLRKFILNVNSSTIENLKCQCGSAVAKMAPDDGIKLRTRAGNDIIPRINIATVIEARMTDIVEYAWAEIREAHFAKKLRAGIVLTGGGAALKDVDELFRIITSQETRISGVELGIDLEAIEDEELLKTVTSPASTMAMSLLVRGAKQGACPVGVLIPQPKSLETLAEPKQSVIAPVQPPIDDKEPSASHLKAQAAPQIAPAPAPQPEPKSEPKSEPSAAPAQQSSAQTIQSWNNEEDYTDEISDGTEDIVKPSFIKRLFSPLGRAIKEAFPDPNEDMDGDDEY